MSERPQGQQPSGGKRRSPSDRGSRSAQRRGDPRPRAGRSSGRTSPPQSKGRPRAPRPAASARVDAQTAQRRRLADQAAQAAAARIGSPVPAVLPTGLQAMWQRLRRDAVNWGRGVATSIAVHAVILLLLTLFYVGGGREVFDALQGAWAEPEASRDDSSASASRPVQTFAPVRIETNVAPVRPGATDSGGQPAAPTTTPGPALKPADVGNMLNGRSPRMRDALLREAGGDDRTHQAVQLGLRWLVRQQQPRGNWQLHEGYPDAGYSVIRTDTGATALALLAFLGDGHTHQSGEYVDTVRRGIDWLVQVQKENGDLHDHVELGRQTAFYAHSQATIALCEAWALTGDDNLREPCRRAIRFLADSQHPLNGGWRYQPQTDKSMGDLSVTGWALMALHTARRAGLELPPGTFERATAFIDSVQVDGGAKYKYMPNDPNQNASVAMTATGLLSRQWFGWPRDYPPMKMGVSYLLRETQYPKWEAGRRNVYAWYYVAQVLHNLGGDVWKGWYQQVQQELLTHQATVGSRAPGKDILGSWHPTKPAGAPEEYAAKAGRLYITAMCLLILETPYRHAPLYAD